MTDTTIASRASVPSLQRLGRTQLVLGGCGTVGILVVAFGICWWSVGRFLVETDDAYVRADVVTITPRVAGNIVEVDVQDNQRVHAGDVLARIDERDYRMKVEQAEGALASAQANVEAQKARIANLAVQSRQQQSNIAQSAAALEASEADKQLAQLELDRQSTLSQQQVTSAQRLQSAQAAAKKASARVTEARALLAAARATLPLLATQRVGAAADLKKEIGVVQQAQASLDAAQLDLARTVVRAPVHGQVGQRTVRVGQYAEVGTPLLAVVPSDVYVVANYKETQANRIRPGQPVEVVVDSLAGAKLQGHVDSFAPASGAEFALLPPDNATGNFTKIVQRLPLKIRLDPGQPRMEELRVGMSVETTVDTRKAGR